MNGNELKLSSYVKAATILIGLFALFILLYIAQGIIVPLIFSIIIAIVLHPLVNLMVRIKINRVVAITIITIFTIIVLSVLGTLLFSQVSRFAEFLILAILYTGAFFILGIDYAILLGVAVSLLNVSYIGPFIGIALVMALALITKSPAYMFYVLLFHIFIQIIDNFYIVPKIVASRVRINALFSIIAMIAGYALWGISGMFLAIPLLAIAKLIFDNIESLKPWGFLLGDTMPPLIHIEPIIKILKK